MAKLTPKNMTAAELKRAAKDTQILTPEQRRAAQAELNQRKGALAALADQTREPQDD